MLIRSSAFRYVAMMFSKSFARLRCSPSTMSIMTRLTLSSTSTAG